MNFKVIARRASKLVIAGLGTVFIAGTVSARSAPPFMGSARNEEAATCFTHDILGTVTNVCPDLCGSVPGRDECIFEIPLPIDSSGTKSVSVNVTAPVRPTDVCCDAAATNAAGTFFDSSGTVCAPRIGSNQNIVLTGITVPSSGRLWVACDVLANGKINTVNWTP